ncbi:zinc-binding dehydrogenase [Mangrovimonas aestuarii]|uniref:zinc-binding dehydrogenase n=1 Tax=Mangrovimonas aestuarii TaxID=3018443 RepID=UPI002377EDE0|nr:alcohol dehydrogenase catalytic domain-containing protein [Mangrovimonas aestuarii]
MENKNIKAEAMVFEQVQQPFKRVMLNLPEIEIGEVLVKIKYTTICTSDLHTYYGRRVSPQPSVLGHEIIGEVVVTGKGGVNDYYGDTLKQGDLVTWSVYAFDEEDDMAIKGIPQKSQGLYKYGHRKMEDDDVLNGGFASHCLLKKGTAIFKLPEHLSYSELAPLNCTHATIAGALRLAGNLEGKNVLVIGAGMLGISACAMSREAGTKEVFAMDIVSDRLQRAYLFGINKSISGESSSQEIKNDLNFYGGIDVVIDTTGVASAMEKGLEVLNIGGIAVWVGAVYSERHTQVNAEMIVRNLITIKGLHNYIPQDLGYAIDFLAKSRDKYPFSELVGEDFALGMLGQAFNCAHSGKHYRVGVIQD